MDSNPILDVKIQQFITDNLNSKISELALKKNPFPDLEYKTILNQIESKFKSKEKLPTWFNKENIIYPLKISIEQTSSEITALYKSNLISGDTLIDLTGGFGVDCYYFSKKIKNVIHCEINTELSEIAKHNFLELECNSITCVNNDGFSELKNSNQKLDWIYIDPSRRNDLKGKVFLLKDCLPNVPELLNEYLNHSNSILIKTAPILDITAGLNELKFVKEIHIVAVENEVKELLWIIENNFKGTIKIKTVNINKLKTDEFSFTLNDNVDCCYNLPLKFLYEPNSAIMKSAGFNIIGSKFKLFKLHQHSHLFTSNDNIEFPGRRFEIVQVLDYTKENMNQLSKLKKMNLSIRNFPDTVDNIRKKWKIQDGGTTYAFFTTNLNNEKIILLCTKI